VFWLKAIVFVYVVTGLISVLILFVDAGLPKDRKERWACINVCMTLASLGPLGLWVTLQGIKCNWKGDIFNEED